MVRMDALECFKHSRAFYMVMAVNFTLNCFVQGNFIFRGDGMNDRDYMKEALQLAEKGRGWTAPNPMVGAVIRGSTSHYDYVCNEVSKGIASVSLQTGVPVLFGVLTTENIEQAIERAGTKAGNKGYDCALSAIEMVNLIREIEG